jgi:type IV secretory pathway VirB2 component (pilin)
MKNLLKKLNTRITYGVALAQIENPLGVENFEDLIKGITTWLVRIASPIGVIVIVYAGAKFLMAKGDPAKINEAKQILWYAVIGLAIVFAASGLVSLVRSIISAA